MDSPETNKKGSHPILLRCTFILLFSLFAVLSVSLTLVGVSVLAGCLSITSPISVPSQCKIVSSKGRPDMPDPGGALQLPGGNHRLEGARPERRCRQRQLSEEESKNLSEIPQSRACQVVGHTWTADADIQNAEDTGATMVWLCLECRLHGSISLLSDRLTQWQGAALLAFNDRLRGRRFHQYFQDRWAWQAGPALEDRQLRISVDLRSSKVCELGRLNYKAKVRKKVDSFFFCNSQVEYTDHSGHTNLALAEAPSQALPPDCRPTFDAAWLTKDKLKVNGTYDCWYSLGISKVNIYHDGFFNCLADHPSTTEMLRRYSI
ncbi:hypothetical protein RJ640_001818, partial [Escallonia rubra]